MVSNCKIYLICYCEGQPIDFLLPVYTEAQFANIGKTAGSCFKIRDPRNAEIVLACRNGEDLQTVRINVESACKPNSYISFSIIIGKDEHSALLRAFSDRLHNAFYPIPDEFFRRACSRI